MSQELNRVRLGEGVHFTSIRDRKFKHNCISINLLTPLEEETVTVNAPAGEMKYHIDKIER